MSELALDIYELPAEYSRNITKVRSMGDEIIWVAAAPGANTHAWRNKALYRFAPGESEPELIYQTPSVDPHPIGNIAGSSAGYAFSDYVGSETLTDKWRGWYVAKPGAEPIMLDEGDDEFNNDWPPNVAMNDRYIVWTGLRGAGEDRVTELKAVSIDALDQVMTLASTKIDDGTVYEPALNGSELWYSFSENDWAQYLAYPRVEMRNLADPSAAPFVLGRELRAGMAAPNDRVVVFKSGGVPEDNPINAGLLTIYWRDTETIEQLPIPGHPMAGDRASYPTVGDRFVAWQDDIKSRLYMYDLAEHQFRRIEELDPTFSEGTFNERSVAGNLLAFDGWDPDGGQFLRWAFLPE